MLVMELSDCCIYYKQTIFGNILGRDKTCGTREFIDECLAESSTMQELLVNMVAKNGGRFVISKYSKQSAQFFDFVDPKVLKDRSFIIVDQREKV